MMNLTLSPYFLSAASNLFFAIGSIIFARFARQFSPMWINQVKVSIAAFCFLAMTLLTETWSGLSVSAYACLLLSGLIGLCIGDMYLFKAFAVLGPTRSLLLYSFQPMILGVYAFIFLGQGLSFNQAVAILCMVGCLLTFMLERGKQTGSVDYLAFAGALLGILFDSVGVMLTRHAFEEVASLGSFQANIIRASGALIGFFLIRPKSFKKILEQVRVLPAIDQRVLIFGCIFGTFVSLSLYLAALKTAHIATLSAISITCPIWVSLFEHVRDRSLPNRYLVLGFSLFIFGFWFGVIKNSS